MPTFTGTSGADRAIASTGELTGFTGGTVADLQDATGDIFEGGADNDRVQAGAGDDILIGDLGDDILDGGNGDDLIRGGIGADVLFGSGGNDTADYSDQWGAVYVDLLNGRGYGNAAEGDLYTSIEHALGSLFADILVGSEGANRLDGADGDDLLVGGLGADMLIGGAGIDTASYEDNQGAVTVDLIAGGQGAAAQGDTYSGVENINGSLYADVLSGDGGVNRIDGGVGDDIILGRAGADVLIGGSGEDTLSYSGSGGVLINIALQTVGGGDAEGDTISGFEHAIGSDGHDTLIGSAAANRLTGGAGDDLLHGGFGADVVAGGPGIDRIDFSGDFGSVFVDFLRGRGFGNEADGDIYSGIEDVIGTSFADMLIGGNTANRLEGRDGDDILVGALGADQLIGGAGLDTASYADNQGGAIINLATGTTAGVAAGDLLDSIEHLTGASGFADQLIGTDAANVLQGLGGSDRLEGAGGDDHLLGGDGQDTMIGGLGVNVLEGGSGNDTMIGGQGADVLNGGFDYDAVYYEYSVDYLVIDFVNQVFTGNAANDTFISIEEIRGGDFGNLLVAAADIHNLFGGDADDIIIGGNLSGTLNGFGGNDVLTSGSGTDSLVGDDGNDILAGGAGPDLLLGGNGDDSLEGGAGLDVLNGSAGDDLMRGGSSRDIMNGGSGADTFVFADGDTGIGRGVDADRIEDFLSGTDKIDLSGIDASSLAAGDQAFSFIETGAFTNTAGQLRYFYNGVTILQGDTNGDGIADIEIVLTGDLALLTSDFVL